MRLGAAKFLRKHYLAGDLGVQNDDATTGPGQRPGGQPEPCFPGSVRARVIQSELGSRAAQHGLDPDGRLEGAF